MSILNFFRTLFKRTENENSIIENNSNEQVQEKLEQLQPSPRTTLKESRSNPSEYIFLDTETTGFNREGMDEIVEIAIIDEAGEILLNTLVKPRFNKEWAEAERVHGISPSDVATAPALSELLPKIEQLCDGKTVVCYNAPFDAGFFPHNFFPSIKCAMRAFAEVNPNGNSWVSLNSAAHSTGYVPTGRSHRALEDALACKHVWLVGIEQAKKTKDAQVLPTINARYTTTEGVVVKAVFDELYVNEIKDLSKGTTCKVWSQSHLDFINVYNGGMGGSGKIASLLKQENPLLAELVTEDNDVRLHVKEASDSYYDCEIIVTRKIIFEEFVPDFPVNFDSIDDDIYRCFICRVSLSGFLGTGEQFDLVTEKIKSICEAKGGRFYKTQAKGARFAIIFSAGYHTTPYVYSLHQLGYKVTTFDRALKYFSLEHMWNIENYLEDKRLSKKYIAHMID